MDVAVVGAGAAGCFAAIMIKRKLPKANVIIYESGSKALAKVAVTGGGRCNLTNSFKQVDSLRAVYPRGERLMKRLLKKFGPDDVYRWFEKEGVSLITQSDQRIFPASGDSMEIVRLLLQLIKQHGIEIKLNKRVISIQKINRRYMLFFSQIKDCFACADKVLIAVGGCPKVEQLDILESFKLDLIPPVPSLFSFCLPEEDITRLMGISVENVKVSLCGTNFKSEGDLLVTHWGMSGPAILKLSSYAARHLADCNYKKLLSVNWMGQSNEQEVCNIIIELAACSPLKQLQNVYPSQLNARLWEFLLLKSGLNPAMRWSELNKKRRNRLVALLTNDIYLVNGKNKFKDEFVTSGGVALSCVNHKTLECRSSKGLYFAGEVLNVDAVTGGFNLQAAWTMGYIVARSIYSVENFTPTVG